ncbi:GNAT family N-acetyltransferase [Halococcus sp. IIIV-5B]|uniref:GNAT family N-acetyltransferase n=1 Tax=Halococcus sp. IIIV-5B TaxID=2321230 RepID=UPI000E70DADD|nr:GNAT family N-acetyltransferase [Halococcus sp. IIIV-5B]
MSSTTGRENQTEAFTIRRYDPSDANRVWDIHKRAIQASPLEFVSNPQFDEDLRNVTEFYLDTGGEFLVGCLDGRVIATGGIEPIDSRAVELQRLRVLPEHQQNGYGTSLLHRLEQSASAQGFERIQLHTDDVLTVAQQIYESRGYEETKREPHPTIDGQVIYYRKSI